MLNEIDSIIYVLFVSLPWACEAISIRLFMKFQSVFLWSWGDEERACVYVLHVLLIMW